MIKHIAASTLVFALALAGTALAQKQITVRKGSNVDYATVLNINISQTMQGNAINMTVGAQGVSRLSAQNVATSAIDWTYQVRDLHMSVNSPMTGDMDTTMTFPTAAFATDGKGNITKKLEASDVMPDIPGLESLFNVEQFFVPGVFTNMRPGQTWETTTVDTNNNGGLEVVTTRTLRHTYQGKVDTLGTSAHRIQIEATTLTVEGGGNMQGMDVTMDGDGTVVSTSYVSAKDGMLLASNFNSEMNVRMSISGMGDEPMLIPMTTMQRATLVRK